MPWGDWTLELSCDGAEGLGWPPPAGLCLEVFSMCFFPAGLLGTERDELIFPVLYAS